MPDYKLMQAIVNVMEFLEFLASPLGSMAIGWAALYYLLNQLLHYEFCVTVLLTSLLLLAFVVDLENE